MPSTLILCIKDLISSKKYRITCKQALRVLFNLISTRSRSRMSRQMEILRRWASLSKPLSTYFPPKPSS